MGHHLRISHTESDSGPCQAIGLGEGIKLHSHLLSPRKPQKASRLTAVKYQLAVGIVVEDNDLILSGKIDQLLIKRVRSQGCGGIIGIRHHHQLRRPGHILRNILKPDDIAIFLLLRHIEKLRPRDQRPVGKYRVAGIRHQHRFPLVHNGQGDMGKSLLRSQKGTDLAAGVQLYAVAPLIPKGHCLQKGLLVINRVDIILLICRRPAQGLPDMGSRRYIGRSHAQIDHPLSRGLLPALYL